VILLDTNVVSELMKPQPNGAVVSFIENQSIQTLFVPSLVVAEIHYGIRRLPSGHNRDNLTKAFTDFLEAGFGERVLGFDIRAAEGYATVRMRREQGGRPVQVQDALIGGMALTHGATLATRNIADFEDSGVAPVDPWNEGQSPLP
jgi:predicted nucleic acid-binding protein